MCTHHVQESNESGVIKVNQDLYVHVILKTITVVPLEN